MSSIAIIGDDLAAAALTLALLRAGVDNLVRYRSAAAAPTTADRAGAVLLTPNASRVLRALGLAGPIAATSGNPGAVLRRDPRTDFLWSDLPLGTLAEDRFGAPFWITDEPALRPLIEERIAGLVSNGLRLSDRPLAIISANADGTITTADGQRFEHSLLVLATGAGSGLCADGASAAAGIPSLELLQPSTTGVTDTVYTAVVAAALMPAGLRHDVLNRWSERTLELLVAPTTNDDRLHLKLHLERSAATTASTVSPDKPTNELLRGWHPLLTKQLPDLDWQRYEQQRTLIPERWTAGRLVLCGGAAQRSIPRDEQATALALEDAWVLSRLIEQGEAGLSDAAGAAQVGQLFERYRRPRAVQVRRRGEQQRSAWNQPARMPRYWTRIRTLISHRFLPEAAFAEYDWLYRYDCIRGFS